MKANDNRPVMVSIRCTVYNHEPYLRDCLNGFVMQKTNFRFEAIVHDDASTDGSAEIIREYAERYPEIIKPIYQTENQYSQKKGGVRKAMSSAMSSESKYIAICEGDDYWTDPLKLQKQIDFLESHQNYTLCFHKVDILSDDENQKHLYDELKEGDYDTIQIFDKWTVPTCSSVMRRDEYENRPYDKRFMVGDNIWFVTCSTRGKCHCMGDIMGVYRRLSTGWVCRQQSNPLAYYEKWEKHLDAMREYFPVLEDVIKKHYYVNAAEHTYLCLKYHKGLIK